MKSGPGNIFQGSREEIPQEMLLRYVSGKATPVEQRLIEQQVSDNPFLADALEGLMKIKDTAALQKQLAEIDTEIRVRVTKPRHRVLQIRRVALVAASLALLITVGWFINNSLNRSSQKIFTDEFQPYHEPQQREDVAFDVAPPVSDSAVKPAETNTTATTKKSPTPEQEKTSVAENVKTEKKEVANSAATAQTNDEAIDIAPQAYTETPKESQSLRAATDTLHDNAVSGVQSDSRAPSVASFSSTEAEEQQALSKARDDDKFNAHKAAWDHAMELYHQGNYAAAISEFEIILKDDPDNQACNFYTAVSYLGLENEDAALKKLKKLDNNKNGPYYEASRWYEGLAYVKKGEKKEAINALEKVVALNGEYKQKAMELLEQLK